MSVALAPDPDDLHCVHRGRISVGYFHRRGRRDASSDGRGGVQRDDRRDALRTVSHACVLRDGDEAGAADKDRERGCALAVITWSSDGNRERRASSVGGERLCGGTGLQTARDGCAGELQSQPTPYLGGYKRRDCVGGCDESTRQVEGRAAAGQCSEREL